MEFYIPTDVERVLILGAGASVDYGLPDWKDLSTRIKEKLSNDPVDSFSYNHKKEILNWIDKIGEGKTYTTLDECIYKESVSESHYLDGVEVEDEIFSLVRDIFNDQYRDANTGWIRKLNEKILRNDEPYSLEQKIAFINYNYDHVLDENFLNYEYLPAKHSRLSYRPRLQSLSYTSVETLCPHGTFFPKYQKRKSHLKKTFETMKTADSALVDAVSCFESTAHGVKSINSHAPREIYILGLGGGLKINLGRIYFGFPISEVHVTIKNKNLLSETIDFLSEKFKIGAAEIKVYDACNDIIDRCF